MISIAWASGVITIPQSFLTLISGTTYELDLDAFRLALKDLEDDEEGMPWPRTHNHNTQLVLAGITFARSIEIIAPYTVVFENGAYGVNCVGANSNIADVLVRNSVSVNTSNSAGLITTTVGGIDEQTVRDALTAQGYTTTRAPKIDQIADDAAGLSASLVLGAGVTEAGCTGAIIRSNIIKPANSQIGHTIVVTGPSVATAARTIVTNDASGNYVVAIPFVYVPSAGDTVFILSLSTIIRGTFR